MKKIILTLIMLIGCLITGSAQTYVSPEMTSNHVVTQVFDDVVYGGNQTASFIQFSIFITREILHDDPQFTYRYQIIVTNHSRYAYNNTPIYMAGVRAFANNILISGAYPYGFWAIVPPEQPMSIFWYKTNDPTLTFGITWENIRYY